MRRHALSLVAQLPEDEYEAPAIIEQMRKIVMSFIADAPSDPVGRTLSVVSLKPAS
jgi:hypothetical protein